MEPIPQIINIGRQFGSGGKSIALEIGRLLDIPVYDNELITKAAEGSGFSAELFRKTDEKRGFLGLLHSFGSGRFGTPMNYVGNDELFRIQGRTIMELADKGPAIFVGRCSNYILRDRKCLDVFISAPLEDRVHRVMERSSLTAEEAEALIGKSDRGRSAYYNFYTFGNWGAASDYDLCVDSSLLGVEGTAAFIIDFGRKTGRLL